MANQIWHYTIRYVKYYKRCLCLAYDAQPAPTMHGLQSDLQHIVVPAVTAKEAHDSPFHNRPLGRLRTASGGELISSLCSNWLCSNVTQEIISNSVANERRRVLARNEAGF